MNASCYWIGFSFHNIYIYTCMWSCMRHHGMQNGNPWIRCGISGWMGCVFRFCKAFWSVWHHSEMVGDVFRVHAPLVGLPFAGLSSIPMPVELYCRLATHHVHRRLRFPDTLTVLTEKSKCVAFVILFLMRKNQYYGSSTSVMLSTCFWYFLCVLCLHGPTGHVSLDKGYE